ncbi:MAG: Uma2 family endonuclease [Streptomyces sp.]|uniref:Uma2 family endonuclease n=1 Tax=Streptomyces sp. TaxID=1931 RepID=UPI003D6B53B0
MLPSLIRLSDGTALSGCCSLPDGDHGGVHSAPPTSGFPEWLRPPQEGFTVDDLFRLSELPPHTQLIDGSLIPRSRQSSFHSSFNSLLSRELRRTCPETLRVRGEMIVVLARHQALEPDVCVIRAGADRQRGVDRYEAGDVVLVVETVDPDSKIRDRERKPQLYARAGIPHFWRVEMSGEEDRPVVYVYELDPTTKVYVVTGIHHDQLKLSVPFRVDIDLTEIDHL